MNDEDLMRKALKQAVVAEKNGEVPVGAVIVKDGEIIARGCNMRVKKPDATAHAEVVAIQRACKKLGRWNLSDCDLYVTLEPCLMCSGAIVYSRIRRVVFGAYDKRFGCAGSVYRLTDDRNFNHRAETVGGVLLEQCLEPIKRFFQSRRKAKIGSEEAD